MSLNSRQVRSTLVESLQLDLIGPDNDHSCAEELLWESPTKWYLTGFLVPTDAPEEQKFDANSADEIDGVGGGRGADDDEPIDRMDTGKSFLPSSVGLSVLVDGATKSIQLEARWGDYQWESDDQEPTDAEEEACEDEDESEENKKRKYQYRRIPRAEMVSVDLAGLSLEPTYVEVPNSKRLHFSVVVRPFEDPERLGLPPGTAALTAFLVNYRTADENLAYRGFAFQCELRLTADHALVAQPDLRGRGSLESQDWDEQLADLQYRDIHDFAVGHGVATQSNLDDSGSCCSVGTLWLPKHEVERVVPNLDIKAEFGMVALADIENPTNLVSALQPLIDEYRTWIEGQKLTGLLKRRQDTADAALNNARAAANRMEAGLNALAKDADAFLAFQLANRTMEAAASKRLSHIPTIEWRPFQLAFILLNLEGLIDNSADDRETVDLLFFPTGGGKTEAYLGLAAFTMVLRRLRNPGRSSCGMSVLMRYTLRLLTLDQLGRAAGLMCALELEREKDPGRLGDWPFEIGLWVGSAATPNRLGGRHYSGPAKDFTAYKKLDTFRSDTTRPAPIPLESCPWCGEKFGTNSFKLLPYDDNPTNLVVRCVSSTCDFNGRPRNLPILSVDEPIYRRLPAFLIATVDKFAALPWEGKAGALLGNVDRYDHDGFYGALDPGKGTDLGGKLPGVDLIIQDELHLISGPLGTIAGVYEVALEELASRFDGDRKIKPKIVASTATVRRADSQIRALFGRTSQPCIFPSQGPDIRDTFFSKTSPIVEDDGRLYLGIAAQGRSLKVVLMRTALALLCASQKMFVAEGGRTNTNNPADPYMTLLGYFNSLKELGGSRRIIEDEVVSRAASYGDRRRIEPKQFWFKGRRVNYEPEELTSRVSTAKVAKTKDRLGNHFVEDVDTLDVVLATNMISVGLDIDRLGLMVVLGQPKGSSEYIQATSRVGRKHPGLVVSLLNVHKPRDRSHYEHFKLYHQTFYRAVEATSVTPFSPRALDRALAASLVGLCRHAVPALTTSSGAHAIPAQRADLDKYARLFAERAETHRLFDDPAKATEAYDYVYQRCTHLLDTWVGIQAAIDGTGAGTELHYQDEARNSTSSRLIHDFLTRELPAPQASYRLFRANRSMRDVEPNVELRIKDLDEPFNN